MFKPSATPRVFGAAPGVDFPKALVEGLRRRMADQPPEAMAQVEIYVNTRRMQRRVRDIFDQGPATLLPRIKLITDLADDLSLAAIPPAVPPLQRRLELTNLVAALLKQQPDLAPKTALYDLADSLAALMDEMQGEGVSPETIATLDVSDQSGHWERSLQFLRILNTFFEAGTAAPDANARQRLVIEATLEKWTHTPPRHPILVAGSTGSRGATGLFMKAVSRLPQGGIILPGFDFDMPRAIWETLSDALTGEDHPQYRFARLLRELDLSKADVAEWSNLAPSDPARNRLISLSLRPAPVTHQWMSESDSLGDLQDATHGLTLLSAPSTRMEAVAIAMRLRQAAEDGQTAALITPNRNLTRQVTAALDKWGIVPDDSAGVPLPLSAPGRFLLHIADLFGRKLTPEALLTLLKHPLTNTGSSQRGDHLRWTHDLELHIRDGKLAFPDSASLHKWAARAKEDDGRHAWVTWICAFLAGLETHFEGNLTDFLETHITKAELIADGPLAGSQSELWGEAAGRKALEIIEELRSVAQTGGRLEVADYRSLIRGVLNRGEVRDRDAPHPHVMIWGTLEARVQGTDLVILGGLNEGIWPEQPAPDPWLNRVLRDRAGLLLPERRIGLSAHDYQQGVGAASVWLTRSVRDADAETVPSRWINRLTNLLTGLPEQNGPEALAQMGKRGQVWLDHATLFEAPTQGLKPGGRPSPAPPLAARPDGLSVTRIRTLIRDPYAIYADKILRLQPLNPLRQEADAPLRGITMHSIFEAFVKDDGPINGPEGRNRLLAIGEALLAENVPWPMARRLWLAKLAKVADWFMAAEAKRRDGAKPHLFEERGEIQIDTPAFKLTGTADRIDVTDEGGAIVYDYKTGTPPTARQQKEYDIQLLLEAAMIERGGFRKIGPIPVEDAIYIGLGANPKEVAAPLDEISTNVVWGDLLGLIRHYSSQTQGYTARRAMERIGDYSDYDHLSRFGEWDITDTAERIDLT
ncbi:double-strand break repair protein AddB [Cognatishimia sp. MH4019]|uniref:double-strand break repair protein AddB n=1 Tax=Cognatishimia sp. MH4019 TaxID=2854030 RepID=UPI001CD556FB|nr:double-strand break repair protein AddB [Cognatishimia sp. MH4019]